MRKFLILNLSFRKGQYIKEKSQINICFNWRNLQPLWSLENTVKKDKYTKQDEKLWNKRMKDLGYEGGLFPLYQTQI